MALPPDQTSSRYGLTAKPNQLSMALPPNQTSSLWPNARQNQIYIPPNQTSYGLTAARPNQSSQTMALPPDQTTSLWPYRQFRPAHGGVCISQGKEIEQEADLTRVRRQMGRDETRWIPFTSQKTFHRRGSQRFIDAANPQ